MGREFVGPALLRQMRGRAGRRGKVPIGETYLCCREGDLEQVVQLMHAELPEVSSCLNFENRRLQRYCPLLLTFTRTLMQQQVPY